MAMTRAQKEAMVAELVDKLNRSKSVAFTSVSGYTMDDANDLRTKGREQGVELGITKKNLLMLALKEVGVEADKNQFEGSILTSFGFEDEVSPAKLMHEFAKERENIALVGGILEGKLVDADGVQALAKLPGKQELYAKLVGSLNSPASGFVNVLAGNMRGLVYALNAIKEAKA